jgi:hypothetical protein
MNTTKFRIGEKVEFSDYKNAKGVMGVVVGCLPRSGQILIEETNGKNNSVITYVVKPKNLQRI